MNDRVLDQTPEPVRPGLLERAWSALSSTLGLRRATGRPPGGAFSSLLASLRPRLVRWTRGRLPLWARARADTEDLVQDAFFGLLRRLPELDPIRREALERYLRRSIQNRVRDEVRRAGQVEVSEVDAAPRPADDTSPLSAAMAREDEERYRCGLLELDQAERELIVGRLDLGYSYDQLALATGRPSADAARVAVRRAMLKLAERIDAR
jgi:RNA polymerase sigma factor (sigma-70 family)